MHTIYTIFRKEVAAFFNSLVGYVVLGTFITLVGLFFWVIDEHVLITGQANMDILFFYAPWFFIFLIPAITMRSFSDEMKTGTIELLLTKPITDWQLITGKYLASAFLVFISLLPTLIYFFTLQDLAMDPAELQVQAEQLANSEMLQQYGGPGYTSRLDNGPIFGAYIGLFFLGMIFAALGVLASAITDNQVVAFILGAVMCFFFYFGFTFISEIEAFTSINLFIANLGIFAHYESISMGVVDTRDILYFLSFLAVALLVTRTIFTVKKSRI